MPRIIADFHIHSHWSRATSKDMNIAQLRHHAKMKGINLLGSGDFTHPEWLKELRESLAPASHGLFVYDDVHFMLTAEVSNIFSQRGAVRKVHNIIFAPGFDMVEEINRALSLYGNLRADGRPTLSLRAWELIKIVRDICDDCLVIPAHAWTPWFSIFGSKSGFDSVEECFGDQTPYIYGLETGLSSDPEMNWRCSALDRYCLISNSDAHSPNRIGREANVFQTEMSYYKIIEAIKNKDKERFLFTIEFFPQEGKYHYDGHRQCGVCLSPKEAIKARNLCPKCGRGLTIGVMHRVEALSDREASVIPENAIPFHRLVPLQEIIAEARNVAASAKTVEQDYIRLVKTIGPELEILLWTTKEDLYEQAPRAIAQGIINVRENKVLIEPGYDGVYGKVAVFTQQEAEPEQLDLF